MENLDLKFHIDDVQSIGQLAVRVGDWEIQARERSERGSLSEEMRTYNRGIADAMQAVRLQFTKLQSGIMWKPKT